MRLWEYVERLIETKDDDLFPAPADVIIAIGCDVSKDGREASPQSDAIARKALELFNRNYGRNVLLVGGYRARGRSLTEAEVMRRVLEPWMPISHTFGENKSFRTYRNARFTLPIMQKHDWKTAIIVAQQLHAGRVRATFKKLWSGSGIEIRVVKARAPYGGGSQWWLSSFPVFLAWNLVPGWILGKLRGHL